MMRKLSAFGVRVRSLRACGLGAAFVVASGLAAACSSSDISAGRDNGLDQGKFTTGWACACNGGALSCPLPCPDGTTGTCRSGEPFCDITVAEAGWACACPNGQSTCSITCPDGTAGECSGGKPSCGGGGQTDAGSDSGSCCPAGWDLYSCTYPNGTAGQACHNPQLGCASSTTCGQGCDPVVTGTCGADAGLPLQWYTTCGYPVCGAPSDAGVVDAGPACPAEGTPCTQAGATCGTPSAANCGVTLVCAAQDPKGGPGGCPISSRQYKDGIAYVDEAQLQRLHAEALGIRLATYTYKPQVADPGPTHLGFIIEDDVESPAVNRSLNRVDMYGYVSMVIAGMQVQEREIAELRQELAAARRDATACKPPRKE
jgi:hypothetical protein